MAILTIDLVFDLSDGDMVQKVDDGGLYEELAEKVKKLISETPLGESLIDVYIY